MTVAILPACNRRFLTNVEEFMNAFLFSIVKRKVKNDSPRGPPQILLKNLRKAAASAGVNPYSGSTTDKAACRLASGGKSFSDKPTHSPNRQDSSKQNEHQPIIFSPPSVSGATKTFKL